MDKQEKEITIKISGSDLKMLVEDGYFPRKFMGSILKAHHDHFKSDKPVQLELLNNGRIFFNLTENKEFIRFLLEKDIIKSHKEIYQINDVVLVYLAQMYRHYNAWGKLKYRDANIVKIKNTWYLRKRTNGKEYKKSLGKSLYKFWVNVEYLKRNDLELAKNLGLA